MSACAVAVLLLSPEGVPLVRDPKKPAPLYWKLPGGRGEDGETPEACAVREIREELGVRLAEDDLYVLEEQDRGSHKLVFFRARTPALRGLKAAGNEGEEIKVFGPAELAALPDLFPNHRAVLQKHLDDLKS